MLYWVQEAFANIRLNRTTTVIAVATTAFTLACFGVFLLLYLNLKEMADSLHEDFQVVVYVSDDLAAQDISKLRQTMKEDPGVESLTYVSKEQALKDFREQFPAESHLLDGLGENPLPASFEVTLAPSLRSPASVTRWTERLRGLPGVAEVRYSREWIESLTTMIGYLELAGVAVGAVLAAASVTIIASTIRLTLHARREEIQIMRLIGATPAFITIPYVLEGAALGTIGSLLSLAILKGGLEFMKLQPGAPGQVLGLETGFHFFPAQVSLLMVLAGLVLGCAGSLISVLDVGRARA